MWGEPVPDGSDRQPVLRVRHLTTRFRTDRGVVTAVDDVSFDLHPGEALAIVGESGCGKTVTSKSVMRLLPEHVASYGERSEVLLDGQNLIRASESTMRDVRGKRIAMIFQEPMTSLNPVFTVGWQLEEALKYHTDLSASARRDKAVEMLRLVEIPNSEKRCREYPHQLSGGMRQRVMIAMALCCEPDVLIADEPTTALDVTIQAQILDLMNGLRQRLNTAIMLITHNLGVVAQTCDRVMVMYAGRVIETAGVRDLFHAPRHPYTKALLESIPKRGNKQARGTRLATIPGVVPALTDLPAGCRFEPRCRHTDGARCVREEPALLGDTPDHPVGAGRQARCHYPLGTPAARPAQLTVSAAAHGGEA
jgi:oligopeptide/dipeptide ABC transporter ATP-binding protein